MAAEYRQVMRQMSVCLFIFCFILISWFLVQTTLEKTLGRTKRISLQQRSLNKHQHSRTHLYWTKSLIPHSRSVVCVASLSPDPPLLRRNAGSFSSCTAAGIPVVDDYERRGVDSIRVKKPSFFFPSHDRLLQLPHSFYVLPPLFFSLLFFF